MQCLSEKPVLHLEVKELYDSCTCGASCSAFILHTIFLPPSESFIYYLNEHNCGIEIIIIIKIFFSFAERAW